jgi:hypothetical protein
MQADNQLLITCYFNGAPCFLSGKDITGIFGPYNYDSTMEDPESKTMKISFGSMNDAIICYHNLQPIYSRNSISLQLNFTLTANQQKLLNNLQGIKKSPFSGPPPTFHRQKFEAFESFDPNSPFPATNFNPRQREPERRAPDRREIERREMWEQRKEAERRELEKEAERKEAEKRKKLETERREAVKIAEMKREIQRKEEERKELEKRVHETVFSKKIERPTAIPHEEELKGAKK